MNYQCEACGKVISSLSEEELKRKVEIHTRRHQRRAAAERDILRKVGRRKSVAMPTIERVGQCVDALSLTWHNYLRAFRLYEHVKGEILDAEHRTDSTWHRLHEAKADYEQAKREFLTAHKDYRGIMSRAIQYRSL